MKKIILLICLLSLTQIAVSQNISFGIKGGLGHAWIGHGMFSKIHPTFKEHRQFLLAYSAGAYLNYSLSKISLQSELLFAHKGGCFQTIFTDANNNVLGTGKIMDLFNYLELPLIVKYSFGEKEVAPFINFGLAPAILLNGRFKIKAFSNNSTYKMDPNTTNPFNLSYIIGSGLNIKKYAIELRYTGSIFSAFPYPKNSHGFQFINNTIMLMLSRRLN